MARGIEYLKAVFTADGLKQISRDMRGAEKGFDKLNEAAEDVQESVSEVGDGADESADRVAKAFKRLYVITESQAEAQKQAYRDAFEAIKNSGNESAQDVARAYVAMNKGIESVERKVRRDMPDAFDDSSDKITARIRRLTRRIAALMNAITVSALRASTAISAMSARASLAAVQRLGGGLMGLGRSARSAAGLLTGAASRITSAITRIVGVGGAVFGGAVLGGGGAAVGFVRSVADTAGEFERIATALKSTAGKDFERAAEFVEDYSATVVFSEEQISQSLLRLRNFGFGQAAAEITLPALINQVSKLGGTYEDLDGIILAVGQAWAKQKLQGEEILQLVERGVPVWGLLEKVTGRTAQELQELSSAGELGRETIALLIQEIGKSAKGSAAGQLDTYGGLVTQLEKAWTALKRAVAGSGVFEAVKDEIRGWIEYLGRPETIALAIRFAEVGVKAMQMLSGGVKSLLENFGGRSIDVLSRWLDRAQNQFFSFLRGADWAFEGVVEVIDSTVDAITRVGDIVMRIQGPVISAIDTVIDAVTRGLGSLDNATTGAFAANIGWGIEAAVAAVGNALSKLDPAAVREMVIQLSSLFEYLGRMTYEGATNGAGFASFMGNVNDIIRSIASGIEVVRGDLDTLFREGFGGEFESPLISALQSFVQDDLPQIIGAFERINQLIDNISAKFDGISDSKLAKLYGMFADATSAPALWALDKLGISGSGDGIRKYATGAVNIQGPGTSTSDSILARLSRGESVLTAAATRFWGPGFIESLNRMIAPPQLAAMAPALAGSGVSERIGLDLRLPGGGSLGVEASRSDLPLVRQLERELSRMKSSMSARKPRGAY